MAFILRTVIALLLLVLIIFAIAGALWAFTQTTSWRLVHCQSPVYTHVGFHTHIRCDSGVTVIVPREGGQ